MTGDGRILLGTAGILGPSPAAQPPDLDLHLKGEKGAPRDPLSLPRSSPASPESLGVRPPSSRGTWVCPISLLITSVVQLHPAWASIRGGEELLGGGVRGADLAPACRMPWGEPGGMEGAERGQRGNPCSTCAPTLAPDLQNCGVHPPKSLTGDETPRSLPGECQPCAVSVPTVPVM